MAFLLEFAGAQLCLLILPLDGVESSPHCIVELLSYWATTPFSAAFWPAGAAKSSRESVAAVFIKVDDGVESEDEVLSGERGLEDIGEAGVKDMVEHACGGGVGAEGEVGVAGSGELKAEVVSLKAKVPHFWRLSLHLLR